MKKLTKREWMALKKIATHEVFIHNRKRANLPIIGSLLSAGLITRTMEGGGLPRFKLTPSGCAVLDAKED